MTRRLTAAVLACICMISFVLIMIPVRASAEETQQFTGEAILLKQENRAYTFQITVSNNVSKKTEKRFCNIKKVQLLQS